MLLAKEGETQQGGAQGGGGPKLAWETPAPRTGINHADLISEHGKWNPGRELRASDHKKKPFQGRVLIKRGGRVFGT